MWPERRSRVHALTWGVDTWLRLAADGVLALHVGVVGFVVLGLLFTLIGRVVGWGWVRNRTFRLVHLGVIAWVVVQAWLGIACPLTVWENRLRQAGGQQDYGDLGFISYWMRRILFYQAEPEVFIAGYTLFGLLVLASWWWVPVRWRSPAKPGAGRVAAG